MNKDLTVGAPDKVLRQFCIPLLGSIIFQQLYNIADSFVAGQFIGETALAAVGTFIVTFLDSYEIKFRIRRRARTVRDEGRRGRRSKK